MTSPSDPDNLSAGEADSLRNAVNDWRVKNGYPESRPKPAEDNNLSVGEVDSLRELINNWRADDGYPRI